MSASSVIAIVSIVAGASVTMMAGWLQYRGTRMAQRQDRLLSYENRIGERRISAYLDVLAVILPIRRWGQEYIAGHMTTPPTLEINQELLVSLAAFGSTDVNRQMNRMVSYLETLRGTLKRIGPRLDKIVAVFEKFGGVGEFEAALAREQPDSYADWTAMKPVLNDPIELAILQVDSLERVIRGEIQDAPIDSMDEALQFLRSARRAERSSRRLDKILVDRSNEGDSKESTK